LNCKTSVNLPCIFGFVSLVSNHRRPSAAFLHRVLLGLVFSSTIAASAWAAVANSTKSEPPEAATEVWGPIPPSVGAPPNQPPADAIVLFDGTLLDAWKPARDNGSLWKIEGDAMVIVPSPKPCDQQTKQAFGDVQLHLEWRSPSPARGEGPDRGNSGVFVMDRYELKILASYSSFTYINGQAGSIYKERSPLVNASRAPGE
jgi:hypothetical protein